MSDQANTEQHDTSYAPPADPTPVAKPSNPDAAPDQAPQVEVVAGPEAGAPAEDEGRVLVFDEAPEDLAAKQHVEGESVEVIVAEEQREPLTELRVGSSGPEVAEWQEREGLHVTGVFTEREETYVKNRQTRRQLDGEDIAIDGVVKL